MTAPLTDDDLAQIEAHLGRVRSLWTAPFEGYTERLLAEVRRLRAAEKAVNAVSALHRPNDAWDELGCTCGSLRSPCETEDAIAAAGYPTETKEDA